MEKGVKILGIAGSLRAGSYNKALLRAAKELVPPGTTLSIFDHLEEIPLFNQDREKDLPESVRLFKEKIRGADAIIFATPEYNYSFPGVLKNAIDWASRPYGNSAWEGKPVAIMSAATGMLGGARAQYHLRQVFISLNMFPLNKPEVIIPEVGKKVDGLGNLTDGAARQKIKDQLIALVNWTIRLSAQVSVFPEMPYEPHVRPA